MDHLTPDQPVFKAGRQLDLDKDPFEFVLSDETTDRVGDVIRASAWDLKDFRKNPIALFGHKHENIIGVWRNVRVVGKQLLGELKLAEEGTSELVDTVRSLVTQGILKTVSVGFRPLEGKPRVKDEPWDGYEYTKASLHEVSLVAVPCNPNAELRTVTRCFASQNTVDLIFPELGGDEVVSWDNPLGKSAFETVPTPNLHRQRERFKRFDIY